MFTRSRSGNKNDGAHVEQKNWHIVRQTVGYHRYDTPAELDLLNRIWALQRLLTNHFEPQQKLISKERNGRRSPRNMTSRRHRSSGSWPTEAPCRRGLRRSSRQKMSR